MRIGIDMDSSSVERRLKKMQDGAREIDGENHIPFNELFNTKFMREYTKFSSIDEMLDKSGFKIETTKDFESIDVNKWDEYVREVTRFQSWEEMTSEAGKLWVLKQMGL